MSRTHAGVGVGRGNAGDALWLIACVAVLVGVAMFAWRGPIRGSNFRANADAIFILTPAQVWLEGGNPYAKSDVSQAWRAAGGTKELDPTKRGGAVYPPGALLLFSPLAPMNPGPRGAVWMGANIGLYLAALGLLVHVAGLSWRRPSAWLLIALGLALSAAQSCLALGQTSILVTSLLVACFAARLSNRPWSAGIVLGLATAIKPQLAGLFIIYEALRGPWRMVAAALAAGAAVTSSKSAGGDGPGPRCCQVFRAGCPWSSLRDLHCRRLAQPQPQPRR
jgi:hypothetical protein